MIIPGKYQKSRENDVENSNRINNITKRYISCLKKYASSFNNKTISNKEVYSFQKKVLDWFFNLSFIDRLKVSSINNKWCFQTLHQLYIEQKAKKSLKFIPRFEQIIIPFMKNLSIENEEEKPEENEGKKEKEMESKFDGVDKSKCYIF